MEEMMIDELSTSTTTTSTTESPLAIETRPPLVTGSKNKIPISPTQPMYRSPPTSSPRGLNTKQAVPANERPAVRACKRILSSLKPSLAEHILDGIPADLGQLPHMAAIDYSSKNKRPGSVNIQCAGTLIDERFVLTAAHCVARRVMIPEFVYFGVANLTDPEEMEHSVKRKIKNIYIHDDYSLLLVYNDIALLELEEPVTFNEYIYPACLHTDLDDLSRNTEVMVSGWGTMTARGNVFSNILLKVPLTVTPIKKCQRDYNRYGLVWRIQQGIKTTQLCAEGRRRVRDACNGDSGGPLVSVGDKLRNTYNVIGVVSAGFSCGDKRPGLYTRVAAYVDYIENIVWPNDAEDWRMGYV
ncbi:serine protease Hayan-like [Musca vetustissima]|uniref:serine protease Hayan-like n=1 Tax=Musca vetustissima TaxID=27455 RepID=UPI002AB699A5|nr:serine protease Hayan-like [Musca vetustissima]